MPLRLVDEVAQATLAASQTARLKIPGVHWLAALDLHVDAVVSTSAGAVTIVNSTLGIIPFITRARLQVEGATTVFDISGKFWDLWSKFDRPGSERVADSSTTSADPWDAVLRYELAQSEANPIGCLPMWLYEEATLEVETGAITLAGTGTNVAVSGALRLVAERYHQQSRFSVPGSPAAAQANLAVAAVVHRLTSFQKSFTATGAERTDLKGYNGELLERLLIVANNNALDDWALFDRISLMRSGEETLQRLRSEQMRARNLRNAGGDDMPITGAWMFDLRRAADADVIHIGGPVAPDMHIVTEIPSGASLTNAKADVIVETLQRVDRAPQAVLAPLAA